MSPCKRRASHLEMQVEQSLLVIEQAPGRPDACISAVVCTRCIYEYNAAHIESLACRRKKWHAWSVVVRQLSLLLWVGQIIVLTHYLVRLTQRRAVQLY